MNYSDLVARLVSATLGDGAASVGFTALLPQAIDYAEQRLYRELNLASNSVRDATSYTLTAGSRNLILPASAFITLQRLSVVTPAGAVGDNGARNPLTLVDWDFLDLCYGQIATPDLPRYWAIQDAANIAVGPWPDAGYAVEIIGTKRPAPISATNMTTTLSLFFPDLLFTAAMIFLSGALLRNYGAQSDDPQQGVTWEMQYKTLMASAATEEQRKKAAAA